jgi:hypothetical protein
MFVSEYDKSMINEILSKQDIYHVTSLPWQVATKDCGSKQTPNNTALRNTWMYDNTGLFKSLDDYSNAFRRIDEYFEHGDCPVTLRQRINIVNELLDCDFDSNLPIHVSFKPYAKALRKEVKVFPQSSNDDSYDNTTLNLNDDSINNHSFIIHPGQTRAQGSVFTRTNLKNALIYVNKKHNVDVKMNSSNYITKIESIEQLLKVYRPSSKVTKNNKVATFSTPNVSGADYDRGFKTHKEHDITILKCFDIKESKALLGEPTRSYHSSFLYTYKSLKSINYFYKLLSNNRFNIYSSNAGWSDNKNNINQQHLYYNHNKHEGGYPTRINYRKSISEHYSSYQEIVFNSSVVWDKMIPNEDGMFSDNETELLKKYYNFLQENKELLKDVFSNSKTFVFQPNYVSLDECFVTPSVDNWKELVTKNNFSGICMYMEECVIGINDRDIHEFLFCINSEVSMTRSNDNKVAIINCEHEYWKTGKNYKEWILPETFYTP